MAKVKTLLLAWCFDQASTKDQTLKGLATILRKHSSKIGDSQQKSAVNRIATLMSDIIKFREIMIKKTGASFVECKTR